MKGIIISKNIVNNFKNHLISEEKSNATIEKYIRDVTAFSVFLNGKHLTKENAIAYKQHLTVLGYAPRSINSVIASLNNLFYFLQLHEYKLKSIKLQRQIYCSEEKELTKAEYIKLIDTANKKGKRRLALLIQTICSTGIRVSELKFITVSAVISGEATVSLKGKTRTVFIVKELRKKLLSFIKEEKITNGSIFVSRNGKDLSRTNIWREMKNLCADAEVSPKKVFPHNLRHLFARIFYRLEKDIARLADILGHSSIETTRIYIITSGKEHRRHMENMRLII